jgi:hypothetical protein
MFELTANNKNKSFSDIWGLLTRAQKLTIYRLAVSGWQFNYQTDVISPELVYVNNDNGEQAQIFPNGRVSYLKTAC